MDEQDFWVATVVVMALVVFSFFFGRAAGSSDRDAAAIKAGVARYTVNATTGETKFEFIKPGGQR